jgi:CRISPR system Cascade subunit CasE
MTYLSRLVLNVRSKRVRQGLNNPYELHRTLSKAFEDDPQSYAEARCLFRIEPLMGRGATVIVQSRLEPNWGRLTVPEDYFLEPPETKSFTLSLQKGQSLAFRLRANPVVCRNGKRLALLREDDQLQWLHRKATMAGFKPLYVVVHPAEKVCMNIEGRLATFCSVLFEGVLCVEDPCALQKAVEYGIGAGKGLGFGLLSLAKPK